MHSAAAAATLATALPATAATAAATSSTKRHVPSLRIRFTPMPRRIIQVCAANFNAGGQQHHMSNDGDDDNYDDEDVADYKGNLCLFLDSANEAEWDKWLPTGLFLGVTTNPAILERDGRECSVAALTEMAKEALEYEAVQEVQIQTWGANSDEMWKNGIALAKYNTDVIVVKVPATFEGIKAANALVADGVRVTITAGYAPHQAVIAASMGANYIAPYLGRMNDAGRDGIGIITEMQKAVESWDSDIRVLVASVRTPGDLSALAARGCDTFTISAKVAEDMFADPLTNQAALDFEAAAMRCAPKEPPPPPTVS